MDEVTHDLTILGSFKSQPQTIGLAIRLVNTQSTNSLIDRHKPIVDGA